MVACTLRFESISTPSILKHFTKQNRTWYSCQQPKFGIAGTVYASHTHLSTKNEKQPEETNSETQITPSSLLPCTAMSSLSEPPSKNKFAEDCPRFVMLLGSSILKMASIEMSVVRNHTILTFKHTCPMEPK